jgi:hypothetical protein
MRNQEQPDTREIRRQIGDLLDSWDAYRKSGVRARRGANVGNFYVAYVFAAHTHRLGRATELLMESGFGSECLPLVRAMYEFALTSQWVMQVDLATASFLTQSLYEKRKTIAGFPELKMPHLTPESVQAALDEIDDEELKPPIAAHFKAICLDLEPEGVAANVNYRLMSAYCHTSEFLIGRYLDFSDESQYPDLTDEPDIPNLSAWANLALTSLMWAGQAVEYVDNTHRRRSQLQAAERLLGTRRILRPSVAARSRGTSKQPRKGAPRA